MGYVKKKASRVSLSLPVANSIPPNRPNLLSQDSNDISRPPLLVSNGTNKKRERVPSELNTDIFMTGLVSNHFSKRFRRTRVESVLEAISEVLYKHPADGSSQFIDPIPKPGAFDLEIEIFFRPFCLSRSHFDAPNSSR
ncbi:hypothetical protein CEXT_322571 [Caerostris extrusa]|uniref:Uncharacterized protein n=1 Tax=Caerostris extrusa TaxID=172846 RepID=A0AAV4W3Q7_CAEEX|nr:hypothetical protein CEXT_322571 [Caerostris extrusa]